MVKKIGALCWEILTPDAPVSTAIQLKDRFVNYRKDRDKVDVKTNPLKLAV